MLPDARFTIRAEIALLETGKSLDQFSMVFTLATLFGFFIMSFGVVAAGNTVVALFFLALLAGLLEKYHALRVAYDAAIFRAMLDEHASLEELDAVLKSQFGTSPRSGDDFSKRCIGARALIKRQFCCFLIQMLFLLCAIAVGMMTFTH